MTRNKKLVKKIGCALLVGVMAFSGVTPFSGNSVVYASSSLSGSTGTGRVSKNLTYDGLPMIQNDHMASDCTVKVDGVEWYYDVVSLNFGTEEAYEQVSYAVNLRLKSIPKNTTEVVLPSEIFVNTQGITTVDCLEIGSNCIGDFDVETVYVPSTYKILADKAFYGSQSLKEVVFSDMSDFSTDNKGENLVEIGDYAFSNCPNLERAIVPENLFSMTPDSTKSTGFSIPDSKKVGMSIYSGCTGLKSVDIEGENIYIAPYTFSGCTSLTELNIADSVKNININAGAFNNCDLRRLQFDCNVVACALRAFASNESLEKVVFNKDVNLNGQEVFYNSFLQKADKSISGSVEFNGDCETLELFANLFLDCSGLTEIKYPDNIKRIVVNAGAFSGTGIKNLTFEGVDVEILPGGLGSLGTITSTVEFNNSGNTILYGEAFTKPSQTNTSVPYAKDDNKIEKVTFNSSLVTISGKAGSAYGLARGDVFYGLNDSNLVFGKNVTKIAGTFQDYTYDTIIRKALGGVGKIYFLNPETVLEHDNDKKTFPDGEYTVYAFPGSEVEKEFQANYPFHYDEAVLASYLKEIQITSTDSTTGLIKFINSVGFDRSKLNVTAYYQDGTYENLSPAKDESDVLGYSLSEETIRDLDNLKGSNEEKQIGVTISYYGETAHALAWVVPKVVVDFEVSLRKDTTFAEGTGISADKFSISNIISNDGSIIGAVQDAEISVRLKSGSDTLVKGDNTVIVSYEGIDKEINVNADEKQVSRISAQLKDTSKKYYPGATLTTADFVVTAEYNNGDIDTDFKNFTLADNVIEDNGSDTKQIVTISYGEKVSLVEVTISKIEVNLLLASYTGTGVLEGDTVDKNNITVTAVYNDGSRRELNTTEFDLVYQPIIADKENEVKIVLVADNSMTTSIKVIGQKLTEFDEASTMVPATSDVEPTEAPMQQGTEPTIMPTVAPTAIVKPPTLTLSTNNVIMGKLEKVQVTCKTNSTESVTWESKNNKIASVDSKGNIIGKAVGSTTITVKTGVTSKTIKVLVKSAPSKLGLNKSMKAKATWTIKKGKTKQINLYFKVGAYSNAITFKSNNTKIATVSKKGLIKAKRIGKAKITAKTYNGKKAVITLKVKKK